MSTNIGWHILAVRRYPSGGSPNGRNGTLAWNRNATVDGYPVIGIGQNTWVKGGAGFALSTTKRDGDYGRGANVYDWNFGSFFGSGGSGGWNQGVIDVTPGQTITLRVGKRGDYNCADANGVNTAASAQATSGFVIIEYGGDI